MSLQTTSLRSPSDPSSIFASFTRLPAEIRLTIYTLSLPAPRLVHVVYQSSSYAECGLTSSTSTSRGKRNWGITSAAPIPALLHVCHESRLLAMKHFALRFQICGHPGSFSAKVWFSRSGDDVMYFGPQNGNIEGAAGSFQHFANLLSMVHRQELGYVRHLAVHESLFVDLKRKRRTGPSVQNGIPDFLLGEFWAYVCDRFVNVEKVSFVRSGQETPVLSDTEEPAKEKRGGKEDWECSWAGTWERQKKVMDFSIEEETLTTRVAKALAITETSCVASSWTPPYWRVLDREGAETAESEWVDAGEEKV